MPTKLQLKAATDADVPDILELKKSVALDQTAKHGKGVWSSFGTERGVRFTMTRATIYIARRRGKLMAMLTLSKRKPWAIDVRYFTPCSMPIYLTDMAVSPALQGQGIGKQCLIESRGLAANWPADAIRLDAYDSAMGAGGFYAACGFREVGRSTYKSSRLIYYELLVGDDS